MGDVLVGRGRLRSILFASVAATVVFGAGVTTAQAQSCAGNCGTSGADGVVPLPPGGATSYNYVSTAGGATGAGEIPGVGGTNGSQFTSAAFTAAAGAALNFQFDFVTSDGSNYTDYAWAALVPSGSSPIYLFTARTEPSGSIVPGAGLPGVSATLTPASVSISSGTAWSPLGIFSGSCFDAGCGNTGWVQGQYTIATAGSYQLEFGVTNVGDTGYDTGLAYSGLTVGTTQISGVATAGPINAGQGDTSANLGGTLLPVFQGGTLFASSSGVIVQDFDVQAYSGNTINPNGKAASFTGVLSGVGGLTIDGAGTVTFTKGETYTGPTTINAGATLLLTGAGSIASSGDPTVNGTFDISGTTSGASIVSLSGSGSVLLGSKTLTLIGATDTFSGVIADGGASGGSGGGLTIAGGTETLRGVNTYTGATTINSGATLALAGGGSISSSSGVIANGTLDISGGAGDSFIKSLSGSSSGQVILGASNGLVINGGTGATFAGVISGSGYLSIYPGTQYLSGLNTYTGPTFIYNGGTLGLTGAGSIASSLGVLMESGATFDISGTTSGASIGTLFGTGVVNLGAKTLTLTGAADTFSGVIADGGASGGTGGALAVASGTEVLTGANTYTGGTTIASGATLQIGNGGTTGSIVGNVTDNGHLIYNLANGTNYVNTTVAGVISGSGTVQTMGHTALYLTGANTYTGGTTINSQSSLLIGNGGTTGSIVGNVTDNGFFYFNRSNTITYGGVISGSGQLAQYGTGTTILTGTNTFTGQTYILAGMLQLGNGGTTGTIASSQIFDAGQLVFNLSTPATYAGVVADTNGFGSTTGALTLAGSGPLTLTGTNTYTGPTTINAGSTLQLGNGVLSTGTVNSAAIVDNGALVVDLNGSWVLSSKISGTGSLTVEGSNGVIALTANNTYTGGTTINAGGFLGLGNATTGGTVAGDIVDNGRLGMNHSVPFTFAGNISGSGYLTSGGVATTLTGTNTYTGGTSVLGGTLQIGNGTTVGSIVGNVAVSSGATLIFNHSDTVTFPGVISGTGGLTQAGAGLLVLNGVNTITGQTTVSSGALEVGDAAHAGASLAGAVVVGAAGTLQGHGAILGSVTNTAGGTVAPGGTIGTLTVGSYTQGANSTLAIEVSPTASSLLNVTGAASLNGKLAVTFDAGAYSPHVWKIVAGAPVTGTFASVSQTGTNPGIIYGVAYLPNEVDLVAAPTSSAQAFGGLSTATLDQAQGLASLVEDRLGDAGCGAGPHAQLDGERGQAAATTHVGAAQGCEGVNVWAQALTGANYTRGPVSAKTLGSGFLAGVDRRLPGLGTLGVAFGLEDDTLTQSAISARSTGNAYYAGLYGRTQVGPVLLDAQGFYMNSDWSTRRTIAGFGVASSSPKGNTYGGLIQATLPLVNRDVQPYARLSYARFDRDAVTETGAGPLGLTVASATVDSTQGELGLIMTHSFDFKGGTVVLPAIRLGLQDDLGSRGRGVKASLTQSAGTDFTTSSTSPNRYATVVNGSLKVKLNQSFELIGEARGRFSSNQTDAAFTLGGAYRF